MTPVLAPPDPGTRVPAPRSATAVPRLLTAVSLAVVVAGAVMSLVGALRTGTSWDEPLHVMRLRNFLDHGWFGLDWSLAGDDPESNTTVYGPVAMLVLHGLGALVGVEHAGTVATSPQAYEVRHVGVALIGLAGTAAAGAITRILLGSCRWALVTAAILLALPMWTGHLMFNIKDVPVATGYTVTTLALIAMVAPVQGRRAVRVLGLAAGIVLMVGTRPGMTVAVVTGVALLGAGTLVAGRFGNARRAITESLAGLALAATALALIYPKLFLHPLELVSAAEQSARFSHGSEASVGYIPFFVAAQVPVLLEGLSLLGLATVVAFARSSWRTDTAQATRYALITAQLLALPVMAIVKHSDLYNALRQLLFTAPAWAVLATLGLARAVRWARETDRLRIVSGIAAAALALPVLDQLSLFPYQYTYYNVALDATRVHVPSDYWRVSARELMHELPTDGQIVCSPTRATGAGAVSGTPAGDAVDAIRLTAYRFAQDTSVDCRTDELGPLAARWSAERRPTRDRLPHGDFYAVIDRGHPTPQNCRRLASVDRTRHLRTLSMTYVARCHLEPTPLPAGGVRFVRDPGTDLRAPLWSYAPEGWVTRGSTTAITATGTSAALTFRAPQRCGATGCAVVLDADAPGDLVASVNNGVAQPVEHRADGTVRVWLPAGATTAWITLRRSSGDPLGLRVHRLRTAPLEN